jgi:hypothetical protein
VIVCCIVSQATKNKYSCYANYYPETSEPTRKFIQPNSTATIPQKTICNRWLALQAVSPPIDKSPKIPQWHLDLRMNDKAYRLTSIRLLREQHLLGGLQSSLGEQNY